MKNNSGQNIENNEAQLVAAARNIIVSHCFFSMHKRFWIFQAEQSNDNGKLLRMGSGVRNIIAYLGA